MAPADLWLPISSVGCESGISPARGLIPVHSGCRRAGSVTDISTGENINPLQLSSAKPGSSARVGAGRGGQVRLATFSQHHVDGLDLALTPLQCMMRSFPNVKDELHR